VTGAIPGSIDPANWKYSYHASAGVFLNLAPIPSVSWHSVSSTAEESKAASASPADRFAVAEALDVQNYGGAGVNSCFDDPNYAETITVVSSNSGSSETDYNLRLVTNSVGIRGADIAGATGGTTHGTVFEMGSRTDAWGHHFGVITGVVSSVASSVDLTDQSVTLQYVDPSATSLVNLALAQGNGGTNAWGLDPQALVNLNLAWRSSGFVENDASRSPVLVVTNKTTGLVRDYFFDFVGTSDANFLSAWINPAIGGANHMATLIAPMDTWWNNQGTLIFFAPIVGSQGVNPLVFDFTVGTGQTSIFDGSGNSQAYGWFWPQGTNGGSLGPNVGDNPFTVVIPTDF